MPGFQTSINLQQAPGIEGDPCSVNERQTLLNPVEGAFVAGSNGLTMGRFAWIAADGKTLNNAGTGAPHGFIMRTVAGAITTYLAELSMSYLPGVGVGNVFSAGDFWVKNAGTAASVIGQKAFASLTNGSIQFAAAGATVSGFVETKWYAMSVGAAGELIKMTTTAPV